MAEGTELIKLALFGQPVKASLSPAIHRMFADQLGLEIEYQAIETSPGEFAAALQTFQKEGGSGCNITLPLKADAWRLSTSCSKQAEQAQAANTLLWQSDGWFADTTDGVGLLADLANNGIEINGKRILVLGAGGAVAGVLANLLAAQPAHLVLANRDQDRARTLVQRFGLAAHDSVIGWHGLSSAGCFELVINATSLGHDGSVPPLETSVFAEGATCYDLNYHHAGKALNTWCETNGLAYLDGLGMLVEQAAASFEIWTGKRPDSSAVIARLQPGAQ